MIMHPSQVQYLGLPDGQHTRTLNCCGVASIPVVIFGGHQIWQIIFTHKMCLIFLWFCFLYKLRKTLKIYHTPLPGILIKWLP